MTYNALFRHVVLNSHHFHHLSYMTLYYYSVHRINLIMDSTINLPGIPTKEDNKSRGIKRCHFESLRGFKFVISVPPSPSKHVADKRSIKTL